MILEVSTGNSVLVCFRQLSQVDVKKYGLTISNGWFNWKKLLKNEKNKTFGLFVEGNNDEIQGVIAIQEWRESQLVHVELMESAPHNRYDAEDRRYKGVGKSLLCFAMHHSLQYYVDFEGYVGLTAKKNYNEEFYQNLNAIFANEINGRPYYFFETDISRSLTQTYMPGGVPTCQN